MILLLFWASIWQIDLWVSISKVVHITTCLGVYEIDIIGVERCQSGVIIHCLSRFNGEATTFRGTRSDPYIRVKCLPEGKKTVDLVIYYQFTLRT